MESDWKGTITPAISDDYARDSPSRTSSRTSRRSSSASLHARNAKKPSQSAEGAKPARKPWKPVDFVKFHSISEAVSIAMTGRFRFTRIVLFCAVVAILLPYSAGLTCCLDDRCEKTGTCDSSVKMCGIARDQLLPHQFKYNCVSGPTDDSPATCVGQPSNEDCICTTDRCNKVENFGPAPAPAPAPGGAPGAPGAVQPLPAPPPPAPKSSADPTMLNIELLLTAAVIKLLKFVL
uniref:Activin_recp domain-containing protein n=1 Tax=Panagrellus redivivus TaxID=6233 RepID=A0A7E4VS21_PANRE